VSSSFMFAAIKKKSHLEFPTTRYDVMFGKMKEEHLHHQKRLYDNDTAARQFAHAAATPF